MRQSKLHNVLPKAIKIAQEEERRVIVYRDRNDQWAYDRYFPQHLTTVSKTVILVNAITGYETLMNSDDLKYTMLHRTI